jgi:hypothetical protein
MVFVNWLPNVNILDPSYNSRMLFWGFSKVGPFFPDFVLGLCRSLNSAEENILELDGSTGSRKPPRKERKKLLTAYASIL